MNINFRFNVLPETSVEGDAGLVQLAGSQDQPDLPAGAGAQHQLQHSFGIEGEQEVDAQWQEHYLTLRLLLHCSPTLVLEEGQEALLRLVSTSLLRRLLNCQVWKDVVDFLK